MEQLEHEATLRMGGEVHKAIATQADLGQQPYHRKLTLWLTVEDHHTWEKMNSCLRASQSVRVTIKGKYSGLFYIVKTETLLKGSVFTLKNDGPFAIA